MTSEAQREAIVNVGLLHHVEWFYDDFIADRSLVLLVSAYRFMRAIPTTVQVITRLFQGVIASMKMRSG